MKSYLVGLLVLLAFIATAQSEKVCDIEGTEVSIPDSIDCESYVNERIESYRFPTFPWIRFPPILTTLLPLLPIWPTTTSSPNDDDGNEECPATGVKQISHSDSCEKYILCLGGNAFERRCADGLHFSRKSRNCVDPDIAECEDDDDEMEWKCPKNAKDDEISLIPNTEDCSKYYVCFMREQFPLSCSEGLHWNIREEACTSKEEAKCKFENEDREFCPKTGIETISHPDKCEKFIICANGNEINRRCPEGLHFSRKSRTCELPEIAECEEFDQKLKCPKEDNLNELIFLPNLEVCAKYYVCFMGEPIPLSCPEGHHWNPQKNECILEKDSECEVHDDFEECPETGIVSISHPTDCEKYILCVGGTRIKRNCASGLHFSRKLGVCTQPDVAKCEDPDNDSEECPTEGVKSISHPTDCEKYILCVGGTRIKRNCASGLHFSRKLGVCTQPDVAKCEDPDNDSEECPTEGVKSISHPTDCEKYILCVGGTRIKRNCASGLHFSRKLGVCTQPDVAKCEDPDNDSEECPTEGVKSISHPTDCEKYILCVGGTRIKRNCASGLHFSRKLGVCTQPDVAKCEDPDNDSEECPTEGVKSISHPTDCEKYILCVGGTRIKRNCGPGLHFSRTLRNCVQPEIAECKVEELRCPKVDDPDRVIFLPNEENCSSYYVCFQGIPIAMTCPAGFHWSRGLNDCVEPSIAQCDFDDFEQCPDEGITAISHPDSCEMFILCMSGTRIERNCAPGFHFSRALRSCVHPHLAGCESEDGEEEEEGYSCPAEDDFANLVFLPSKENCGNYYLCHQGEQFPFTCANNLYWNREKNMCMEPIDAGCKQFAFDDFVCPTIEGIEYYHNPTDCQSYYVCDQGQQSKQTCEQGMLWNRTLKMCNSAESVECH